MRLHLHGLLTSLLLLVHHVPAVGVEDRLLPNDVATPRHGPWHDPDARHDEVLLVVRHLHGLLTSLLVHQVPLGLELLRLLEQHLLPHLILLLLLERLLLLLQRLLLLLLLLE